MEDLFCQLTSKDHERPQLFDAVRGGQGGTSNLNQRVGNFVKMPEFELF